ncbi:MAG: PRPP-binding protein adenine/guanine phosphoribosyltransferase [Verrucomicrobiaceae bacterium]|nr:PRPP-binding protein adenine/guanine phosphoribosyltransferase [Verrucomicrobiaceae bacterium]
MPPSNEVPTSYCLSWDEFHRDTRALAAQLIASGGRWQGLIAIARGGLIPAGILARELNLRLVDTLCIASYAHDKQGIPQTLKIIDGDGAGFLLVDDLVDSGVTAHIARQLLPRATFATVYAKPQGKSAADYWQREFTQDTWIHFPWDIAYRYAEPMIKAD